MPSSDPFAYERWPSRAAAGWQVAAQGGHPHDQIDFHVDLGCGKLPKGRIGVDRYPAEGVAVISDFDVAGADLDPVLGSPRTGVATYAIAEPGEDATLEHDNLARAAAGLVPFQHRVLCRGLPFLDDSIRSVISHHALEHVGDGFIPLMEEVFRVLEPGGVFRIIVPLFPSWAAVSDPDHRRLFMCDADGRTNTFGAFCGGAGGESFLESFSVPYTTARFVQTHQDMTARLVDSARWWTTDDAREMRITLEKRA